MAFNQQRSIVYTSGVLRVVTFNQKAVKLNDNEPLDLNKWKRRGNTSATALVKQYKGTVYAVVKRIADKITSTELRLYTTAKSQTAIKAWNKRHKKLNDTKRKYMVSGGDDVAEVLSSPATDLLHRPNPLMTGRQLITYTQLYLDIAGVCYWRLMKDGTGLIDGEPDSIYVLPPHLVKIQKNNRGSLEYKFGNETLQPSELLIIASENLDNPVGNLPGVSGIGSVADLLELQTEITNTLIAIMHNEGRPSGILAPKGEYSMIGGDEAADRWRMKYRQAFMAGGSGEVMVLDGDATFTPLSYKPTDLACIPLDKHIEEKICQAYTMPVMIHRGVEGGSRAAYQTALQEWADGGLSSRLRDLEDFLNYVYLPRFDNSENLFFCFDDPSPSNAAEEEARVKALVDGDLIYINEGRAMLGLAPVDGGDTILTHYRNGGVAVADPLAPAADPVTAAAPAPVVTQQEIETNPASTLNGAQITSALDIVSQVANGLLPRASGLGALQILLNLSEQQAATIMGPVGATFFAPVAADPQAAPGKASRLIVPETHTSTKAARKPLPLPDNDDLEPIVRKHYRKWAGAIEAQVKGMADGISTKGLPKKFVPLKAWAKDLAEDSQPVIELIQKASGKKLLDRVGASPDVFNVFNQNVKKRAATAALDFAQSTLDTTTKSINDALDQTREAMADGLEEGEGIDKITKRIGEIFEDLETNHAKLIARTESNRAHNEGLRDSAKESGVVKSFSWETSSDPCPDCAAMDGKEIGLDGDLPPLHPNCFCLLLENIIDD